MRARAEKRIHGLAFGNAITGKFVAEIVEGELRSEKNFEGVGERFGRGFGEKLLHLLRRFQMTLGVARQQASSGRKCSMIPDGGVNAPQEFAILGGGVAENAIGSQQQEIQGTSDGNGGSVTSFFLAMEVALQLNVPHSRRRMTGSQLWST